MHIFVYAALLAYVGTSVGEAPDGFELNTRILIDLPEISASCPKIEEGIASFTVGSKNRSYSYLALGELDGEESRFSINDCPLGDPLGRPLIRKCCHMEAVVAGSEGNCMDHEPRRPFNPKVRFDNGSVWAVDPLDHFLFVLWDPCHKILDSGRNPADEFILRGSDGSLTLPHRNGTVLNPGEFCLDYVLERSAYLPFLCEPGTKGGGSDRNSLAFTLYPVALLISTPFLLATFLVYAFIKELRNLHGKTLMCLVGSYFVSFLFLAFGQLGLDGVSKKLCVLSAFITEFSFLAAFFWLNVTCFDIFLAFSGLLPLRKPGEHAPRKFLFYSLYAWGVPFLIFILSLILEFAPGIPEHIIRPEFGVKKCWFKTGKALAAYFYGPIAIILVSNVVMFAITAMSLYKLKKETAVLRNGDSGEHTDDNSKEKRQRFTLYLKLLIIMGVNWIMEVIQTAVKGPDYLWLICDLLNALQGVFIFFIFVWKRRVRDMVLQRLCPTLTDSLTGRNGWLNSLIPWHRGNANDNVIPSQTDSSSRGQTLSTPLQSNVSNEPEEMSTLTTNMR